MPRQPTLDAEVDPGSNRRPTWLLLGGLFAALLAYADDILRHSPCWWCAREILAVATADKAAALAIAFSVSGAVPADAVSEAAAACRH